MPPASVPPLRVLLVEDDADHAELVRRGLAGLGARVELTVRADAEAALDTLRAAGAQAGPHLVLLDLRLPGMTGLQLLRELKGSPATAAIPCAVLTTSEADTDVARARELDASRYLVKPADEQGLGALLAEVEAYWAARSAASSAGR
jgi:CheY-like chemotaxis protein